MPGPRMTSGPTIVGKLELRHLLRFPTVFATTNFPLLIADLGLDVDPSAMESARRIRKSNRYDPEPGGCSNRARVFFKIEASVAGSPYRHEYRFPSRWFFCGYLAHKRKQRECFHDSKRVRTFPLNLAK